MEEITKTEFISLLETDPNFEFLGEIDGRVYARQRNYSSNIPSKEKPQFRLVYAVL
jgi:hypothetical protein